MLIRDVNYGWFLRYLHANGASAFFIAVYAHIGRGLYYSSYKGPRTAPWTIGVIILIVIMGTAFLGYSPISYMTLPLIKPMLCQLFELWQIIAL